MSKLSSGRNASVRILPLLIAVLALIGAWALWGALRLGDAPAITIETEREAIGAATKVVARFGEPRNGLGKVRLELVQGDHAVVLAERTIPRRSPFLPGRGPVTAEAMLEAVAGKSAQEWLAEGEAVVRATADRFAGPLRSAAPMVVEKRLSVLLRPPRLELLSSQHYVRQGGAGVVVFRVSESASRSGVRAGGWESISYARPGAPAGERFALYALPFELGTPDAIRLFAEDAAGNHAELPFVTLFKKAPPRSEMIEITDAFLARVVPAIASQTPGFSASGGLLEEYLKINGELRRANLAFIRELAGPSEEKLLWSGPFLQMPNTQLRANFAESRTYRYQGKAIDRQTHLGLDLASLAQAPVPAPNAGRVAFAGWLGIYGNAVLIDHGYGLASLCGHLSSVAVKAADAVTKGQTIGASGATGLAGGDHLHLEIFVQGRSVNPIEWLDAHWIADNLGTKLALPAS
ncbi:MAG: M23 family metallopeptidase [Acidobacteriota bacterium]